MPIELRNSDALAAPAGFSHLSIATGSRVVHLAGQLGTSPEGEIVPDGLAAQTERALLNFGLALDAAGANEQDLAKVTIYVVGWNPSMLEDLFAGFTAAAKARPRPDVPVTLIGVQALFQPDALIEVEGVAILD